MGEMLGNPGLWDGGDAATLPCSVGLALGELKCRAGKGNLGSPFSVQSQVAEGRSREGKGRMPVLRFVLLQPSLCSRGDVASVGVTAVPAAPPR